MLMEECFFYKAHQEEIIKDHLGEYVVIKSSRVLGYYKGLLDALNDMVRLKV
jgi:hypothetical protein